MSHESNIIHHSHKQKRAIEAVAKVEGMSDKQVHAAIIQPSNRFKRILDKTVYFTGALSIVMTIPQILQIYLNQNASGVTFVTWFTFLINAIIWTTYGIIHREKLIIMMYVSYLIIDLFIVTGIIIYG